MSLNRLATAYRPTTFDEVVGHELSVRALRGMVASDQLPTGLMFSGASGAGKTTLARIVANELDADVTEVDAASHGGVAEVRTLTDNLRYSTGRARKVLVIDEAHSLSRDAFNALLKTLEEPPEDVLFILVTTDVNKVPKTVRTRLIEFDFAPVSPRDILMRMVQVARAEGIKMEGDLLKYIATHSDGSVRKALTDMGMAATAEIVSLESFMKLVGEQDNALELMEAMWAQDVTLLFRLADSSLTHVSSPQVVVGQIVELLRELMVIRNGGIDSIIREAARKNDLSRDISPEKQFAMVRILWDLKTQVKTKGDPRTDLELALMLLYDVVNKGRTVIEKPTQEKLPVDDEEMDLESLPGFQKS